MKKRFVTIRAFFKALRKTINKKTIISFIITIVSIALAVFGLFNQIIDNSEALVVIGAIIATISTIIASSSPAFKYCEDLHDLYEDGYLNSLQEEKIKRWADNSSFNKTYDGFQWISTPQNEYYATKKEVNDYLLNNSWKIIVNPNVSKISKMTNESKKHLAAIMKARLSAGKKITNGKLVGLNTDFIVGTKEVSIKRTDYYSYISTDDMIFKAIKSRSNAEFFQSGEVFGINHFSELTNMKDSVCTNVIGVNIQVETSDGYFIVQRQKGNMDANGNKIVPSGSGSLEIKDYKALKKHHEMTFSDLLFQGMFRELFEESRIKIKNDDISEKKIIGYIRLLSKSGKPDFFSYVKVNKTKDQLKKEMEENRIFIKKSENSGIYFIEKDVLITNGKINDLTIDNNIIRIWNNDKNKTNSSIQLQFILTRLEEIDY